MTDRPPTDPAPRGADAPDPVDFASAEAFASNAADPEFRVKWQPDECTHNLARAFLALVRIRQAPAGGFTLPDMQQAYVTGARSARDHHPASDDLIARSADAFVKSVAASPVPAEATGGTVETRIQRLILTFGGEGFVNLDEVEAEIRALVRDVAASAMGQDRDAMFERMIAEYAPPRPPEPTSGAERQEVVAWNAMVDVLNEVAPGWADDWDGSTTIDAAVKAIRALRTPPAPLPREGAMRTEIESAMRELLDIRMDDLRCPVGITDEAFAGAALGAWKRIRYAMEHLTVALTLAAQPTTKETR